jgi:hypothetical protein
MSPLQHVFILRIWLAIVLCASGAGIAAMLVLLDPTINMLYIFGFLFLLFTGTTSGVSLLGLWWFSRDSKRLLTVSQVYQIVYQSIVCGLVAVLLLVLAHTAQLTIFSGSLVLIAYILYQLWIRSR